MTKIETLADGSVVLRDMGWWRDRFYLIAQGTAYRISRVQARALLDPERKTLPKKCKPWAHCMHYADMIHVRKPGCARVPLITTDGYECCRCGRTTRSL